jgi:hypothetical protein
MTRRLLLGTLAAALLAAGAGLVATTTAGAATNQIEGTVVDAASHAPVAGVEVSAVQRAGVGGGSGTARTDAAGHYLIANLPPGGYVIRAYLLGYAEQYAIGRSDSDEANAIYVPPNRTVNFTLTPTRYGVVTGALHRHTGAPIAGAAVRLTNLRGTPKLSTTTDAAGRYRFEHVEPRDYQVRFELASGTPLTARNPSGGAVFTVPADTETTVDEVAPPLGTLTVTVTDAATGQPLPGARLDSGLFRPVLFPSRVTDANGTVSYVDLPAGAYAVGADPPSTRYLRNEVSGVVVREDATTRTTVGLKLATAIHVSVVDAATSAPAPGFCLEYLVAGLHNVPQELPCSGGSAELDVAGLVPDRYKLFVAPTDGAHGAQWVGPHGGTGDLDLAQAFDAQPGQTVHVTVRLDRAGAIAGTIRDRATRKPVGLCASVLPAPAEHGVYGPGVGCADTTGRYTISGLGPYHWKVEFTDVDGGYAWQWSGDAANRHKATAVAVKAGHTATANAALRPSGRITGTAWYGGRDGVDTQVLAVDADTGDVAGFHGVPGDGGAYTIVGLGDQQVEVVFTAAEWASPFTYRHPGTVATHAGKTVTGIDFLIAP